MRWETRFSIGDNASGLSNPFKDTKIQLVGEWVKFDKLMGYLTINRASAIKRDIAKGQRNFLTHYKRDLIDALMTEGSSVGRPFAPWSKNYKDHGPQIGWRSGKYINAINRLQITSKNYQLSLSFSPSSLRQRSKNKGTTLARYAWLFEYGGSYQPARPIWIPTFNKIGGSAKAQQYLIGSVGKRIKAITG